MTTRQSLYVHVLMVVVAAGLLLVAGTGKVRAAHKQCHAQLATCTADLADCEANASAFPATGQTTFFQAGDDGAIQAGADLSYIDIGVGTIIDDNTGLEWEKKSDEEVDNDNDNTTNPHDKDNLYTWDQAFTVHVAGLNTANFADHNDWRVPNVKELQSIVNYQFIDPAVSDAFKAPCASGATVTDGSCTAAFLYWSSTTNANAPGDAWGVDFRVSDVNGADKIDTGHVRAVRGGSL